MSGLLLYALLHNTILLLFIGLTVWYTGSMIPFIALLFFLFPDTDKKRERSDE